MDRPTNQVYTKRNEPNIVKRVEKQNGTKPTLLYCFRNINSLLNDFSNFLCNSASSSFHKENLLFFNQLFFTCMFHEAVINIKSEWFICFHLFLKKIAKNMLYYQLINFFFVLLKDICEESLRISQFQPGKVYCGSLNQKLNRM